ncbi:aminotransferase class I/II-fold pyridoxal phosphate-dependent enzyme [Parafilimonas sp.]|uniref:aminotransferase class I/II-fold pyridoxal phosphate-dependent enzyme n=1 Tax=Parafilimonas sp. TaxID=1969739 RepID=UPI003F7FA287
MNAKIWLSSPHMCGKEKEFVEDAFTTNWIAPLGPNVDGFENDLETYLGEGMHVAALSSGTAAIHLALILLGVQNGDEVICQSMTFSGSANPIVYQGATPVFVDSEKETWNMSPSFLEEAIKDRIKKGKKPKAIIPVHLYGMPCKMHEILSIANEYEIPVIEDAAEALGSMYFGKKTGTFGTISILSFNGNKIITTSGGGAIVSNNKTYIERAKFLSTQARDPAPHYEHSHIGYNYRMSNVCAGIGRGQMTVLEDRVKKKRAIFKNYQAALNNISGISFQNEPENFYSNRWLTTILIDSAKTPHTINNEHIRLVLEKSNIESRPLWKPMHLQPVFKDAAFYGDRTSDKLFEQGLCLPSGSNLTEEAIETVKSKISLAFTLESFSNL